MTQLIKKIYTVLVLFKNLIARKKHYTLSFSAELDNNNYKRWYYVFKNWGFSKDNLEMVAGAEHLCDYYAYNRYWLTIDVIATNKPIQDEKGYDKYTSETLQKDMSLKDKIMYGRTYYNIENEGKKITTMWICPVTLFVLGRYPRYIYIKSRT